MQQTLKVDVSFCFNGHTFEAIVSTGPRAPADRHGADGTEKQIVGLHCMAVRMDKLQQEKPRCLLSRQ